MMEGEQLRQSPRGKTCSSCCKVFLCGPANAEPCWCNSLPPLREITEDRDCLCPNCLAKKIRDEHGHSSRQLLNARRPRNFAELIEGEDFYRENGRIVFSVLYHLSRGYCCGNGCRHCPY